MTQNIYDDPEFFEGYSQLRRSVEGLSGAPEWLSLRAMLPDMRELRVLDLGCGYGWFCRWARDAGASYVLGLDISERMLERARSFPDGNGIDYRRADLAEVDLSDDSFDLVYSSLALHYLHDLSGLFEGVHRALSQDGRLVFSVEHPVFTAPSRPEWFVGVDGKRKWPLDGYLNEGRRETDWITHGVVKYHRTMATYVNLLIRCGFTISEVVEWGPNDEQVLAHPEWDVERDRPPFLLVSALKRR